jgi:hypothetical protein
MFLDGGIDTSFNPFKFSPTGKIHLDLRVKICDRKTVVCIFEWKQPAQIEKLPWLGIA